MALLKEKKLLKGLKHNYGRINEAGLIKAIGEGMNYKEAGEIAGSKAKDKANSIALKIKRNPRIKKSIIEKLAQRQEWILNSIKHKDIKSAPLNLKAVSFGIMTDKLQLLKGDPTARIETIPKMVFEESKEKKEKELEAGKGEEIKPKDPNPPLKKLY